MRRSATSRRTNLGVARSRAATSSAVSSSSSIRFLLLWSGSLLGPLVSCRKAMSRGVQVGAPSDAGGDGAQDAVFEWRYVRVVGPGEFEPVPVGLVGVGDTLVLLVIGQPAG